MPRIPTATSQAPYPGRPISPERATVEARALSEAGEKLAAMGKILMERERKAARAEKGLRIENQMNEDIGKLAESYYDRIDYENFEKDSQESLTELRSKYTEMAGSDRELRISVDRVFNQQSAQFMLMIRQKKRQVLVERSLGELAARYNQDVEAYANETDEEIREMIATRLRATVTDLAENHIMTAAEAANTLTKFANDADQLRLEKVRFVNAETAMELLEAGGFAGLKPDVRQAEIERTQNKIYTDIRRKDVEERMAERERKRIIEDNDFDMWERYYENDPDLEADLEQMAKNRAISDEAYRQIREKLKKGDEAEEDNPIIVGDIADAIERHNFREARRMLQDALRNENIKGQTYIGMRRSIAEKSYADGIGYINKAMQPSELDSDFYRKQKHADAIADYSIRVGSGEDPIEAAKDIVRLNASRASTDLMQHRKPRYFEGDEYTAATLAQAAAKTLDAFTTGKIQSEEYLRETALIQTITQALEAKTRADKAVVDIESELKKRKLIK